MKIAVTGASGFIGSQVIQTLSDGHDIIALSRRPTQHAAARVQWRQCNMFSLLEVERGLEGAEVGVYLVHSMLPPNRLTQGRFDDLDLILADNFARAARLKGLRRIVYLGGIIHENDLSRHLESRLEVERVLSSTGIPIVALRAGLITGAGGSSFAIMERLVKRLPVMVCPKWATTRCQPIDVSDVVKVIVNVVDDPLLTPGSYDIAGDNVLSYVGMMREVAEALGVKRRFLSVGFVSPWLSRLWVSVVTGASRQLVYPLIESLRHDMLASKPSLLKRYSISPMSFREGVRRALLPAETPGASRPRTSSAPAGDPAVTSVQRIPIREQDDVSWIAAEYAAWLPRFLRPFIRVDVSMDRSLVFRAGPLKLLELSYSESRSSPTRQLYYLTGGLLLRKTPGRAKGRLEFRQIPGRREVIAAILDFRPRLPWWIYRLTQAKLHLLVMHSFALHVRYGVRQAKS